MERLITHKGDSMNWGGLLRVIAPRLIGVVASAGAGWIYTHSKGTVSLDPDQLTILGTTMLASYAAGHTATAAAINPAAAATPTLAEAGKEAQKEISSTPTIVNNQGVK